MPHQAAAAERRLHDYTYFRAQALRTDGDRSALWQGTSAGINRKAVAIGRSSFERPNTEHRAEVRGGYSHTPRDRAQVAITSVDRTTPSQPKSYRHAVRELSEINSLRIIGQPRHRPRNLLRSRQISARSSTMGAFACAPASLRPTDHGRFGSGDRPCHSRIYNDRDDVDATSLVYVRSMRVFSCES
jgi:hypothetical protein